MASCCSTGSVTLGTCTVPSVTLQMTSSTCGCITHQLLPGRSGPSKRCASLFRSCSWGFWPSRSSCVWLGVVSVGLWTWCLTWSDSSHWWPAEKEARASLSYKQALPQCRLSGYAQDQSMGCGRMATVLWLSTHYDNWLTNTRDQMWLNPTSLYLLPSTYLVFILCILNNFHQLLCSLVLVLPRKCTCVNSSNSEETNQ